MYTEITKIKSRGNAACIPISTTIKNITGYEIGTPISINFDGDNLVIGQEKNSETRWMDEDQLLAGTHWRDDYDDLLGNDLDTEILDY